jgi:type I restriction enzyme, S subunit
MGSNFRETEYGQMCPEWKNDNLDNLCIEGCGVQTGPFGSQLHQKDYVQDGTPIITVEHLGDNRITHQNLPMVSDEDRERLNKYELKVGDIVFSRVGSVDRRALVRYKENGWLFSGRCLRVRPRKDIIDSTYLYYFFGLSRFKDFIRRIAVGATMPSLNTKLLSGVNIYYPTLVKQRAIAEILGSLDDKIELNRRTNVALEEMARAIFKSWFIDFDPVIDKALMAGNSIPECFAKRAAVRRRMLDQNQPSPGLRPPSPSGRWTGAKGAKHYMSQEVFAQLPDSFQDSELGQIPKGWEHIPIGEMVEVVGGGTPSTKNSDYWEGGDNAFCTPKDMSGLVFPVLLETDRHLTHTGVYKISSGQLPIGTVILSSRAPIGYLALTEIPITINQGIIAMQTGKIPNIYILLWTEANIDVIKNRAGGSTFAEISKRHFRPIPALRPDDFILKAFGDLTRLYFEMITSKEHESCAISKLRDILLPKLISGELRV